MRTARLHSEVKEKLCECAQRLMLVKGFPATTVDEICGAAGVTKGSFFHYFDSKEHLGKELIERFLSTRMEEVQAVRSHRDPLRRIYAYIDGAIRLARDPQSPRGCIMGTFAQELSQTYPELNRTLTSAFEDWMEGIKSDFEQAKARYAPDGDFDARSLGDYFLAVFEGSHVLAKVHPNGPILETNLRHFKHYIQHLFGLTKGRG